MGYFSGLFDRIRETRFLINENPPDWWTKMSGLTNQKPIQENFLAVQTCIKILAESVASLPVHIYKQDGTGRVKARDHNLWRLLHDKPNPNMTAFSFWEFMTGSIARYGNAYAAIQWSQAAEILQLSPMDPAEVQAKKGPNGILYLYRGETFESWEIFHVPGFGGNGIFGKSPIAIARDAIRLGQSAETFGINYFDEGAKPSVVLHYPEYLDEKNIPKLRKQWREQHAGIENAHSVAILDQGIKMETFGIPPEDSQFLETRQFQKREIAGWYRIPPHMLADLDRATFSNIEQQSLEFVIYSLQPYLRRFEQTIFSRLILPIRAWEQMGIIGEFNVNNLLRGDITSRFTSYSQARQSGWMSVNDIRRLENMNPIENGDIYLQPLNMIEAGAEPVQDQDQDQDQDRSRTNPVEKRAEQRDQAAINRHVLIGPWGRIIADVLARVYRREKNDVLAEAKRQLKTRNLADFESWLESFYADHEDFIFRQILPVMTSYAEIVRDQVVRELDKNDFANDIESFIKSFVGSMSRRLSRRHLSVLLGVLQSALDNGQDLFIEIENKLEDWENRAEPDGLGESVRANNGMAKQFYTLAGVLALTWRSFGDSCPYCESLNGSTVRINDWFLDVGDFEPSGSNGPLKISRSVGHPPAHSGCDCIVISGGF